MPPLHIPSAPPMHARVWGAPEKEWINGQVTEEMHPSPTSLGLQETIAEALYIGRPLVHCILPNKMKQATIASCFLAFLWWLKVCFLSLPVFLMWCVVRFLFVLNAIDLSALSGSLRKTLVETMVHLWNSGNNQVKQISYLLCKCFIPLVGC